MSDRTATRSPSLIRPIAMPATGVLIGTPPSIKRQDAAADRRHRRAAVRLEDLRDDPDRVGEVLLAGQDARDRALGQVPVADLAAARAAQRFGLARRERREVVVQHEALVDVAGERLDVLRVLAGPEGGRDQRLRLAAREQRRAVRPGQHAHLAGDLRGCRWGAPVDAAAGVQHQLAQVLLLRRFVRLADLGAAIGERLRERRLGLRARPNRAPRSARACRGWPSPLRSSGSRAPRPSRRSPDP